MGVFDTYRDLKEPEGWRSSSLRKILLELVWLVSGLSWWVGGLVVKLFCFSYHPACLESVADSMRGVSIQGFLILSGFASIL